MPRKRKAPATEEVAEVVGPDPVVETPVKEQPEPPKPRKDNTLRLRLLRNEFVNGAFAPQGSVFQFPREDAEKRLRVTSDTWEVL